MRVAQSGFTLIEVLVASLILAIGLIGVAGLQAMSLKNNQSAFMRSQATALAYDLADRMRANVNGANAGFYNPAAAGLNDDCISANGCSGSEMALHDLAEWNETIDAYLPMGEGFVCRDSTPNDGSSAADPACDGVGNQFSVKVWWDDNFDGEITVSPTITERVAITFQL